LNNQYNYSITHKNILKNRMFFCFFFIVGVWAHAKHYIIVRPARPGRQTRKGFFLQRLGRLWGSHEAQERKRIKRQETSKVTHIHKANHGTQREKKSNTPTNVRVTQYPRHFVRRKKIRKMTKSYKKCKKMLKPARLQGYHET
jgi:hypothetical protein